MNPFKALRGLLTSAGDVSSMQTSAMIRFGMMWLIYIGLAKSDLSLDVIAQYELFIFSANLFSFALLYGGKNAVLNFQLGDSGSLKTLQAGAVVVFSVAGLVMASLFVLVSNSPDALAGISTAVPPTELLALYIFLLVSGSVLDFFLLLQKDYKWVVRQSWFFNGLMVLAVLVPTLLLGDLYTAFVAMSGVLMLQWLSVIFLALKGFKSLVFFPFGSFLYTSFLPLSLYALLGGLSAYIDGYLVLRLDPSSEVFAVFRYGARELPLATLMTGGIVSALIPVAAASRQKAGERMRRELRVLYHQLFPLTIVLMLISPLIYPLVFSPEFAASAGIFNIYLLLLFSRLLIPQVFLYAEKRNRILNLSALVEIIVNIGLSVFLFQYYGVYGIAWASVIAFMVSKLVMWYYAVWHLKLHIRLFIHPGLYVLYGLGTAAAYAVSLFYTQWI